MCLQPRERSSSVGLCPHCVVHQQPTQLNKHTTPPSQPGAQEVASDVSRSRHPAAAACAECRAVMAPDNHPTTGGAGFQSHQTHMQKQQLRETHGREGWVQGMCTEEMLTVVLRSAVPRAAQIYAPKNMCHTQTVKKTREKGIAQGEKYMAPALCAWLCCYGAWVCGCSALGHSLWVCVCSITVLGRVLSLARQVVAGPQTQ